VPDMNTTTYFWPASTKIQRVSSCSHMNIYDVTPLLPATARARHSHYPYPHVSSFSSSWRRFCPCLHWWTVDKYKNTYVHIGRFLYTVGFQNNHTWIKLDLTTTLIWFSPLYFFYYWIYFGWRWLT
jgi:hypothetical protein